MTRLGLLLAAVTACSPPPPRPETPPPLTSVEVEVPEPEPPPPPAVVVVAPPRGIVQTIDAIALVFELPSAAWKKHPGVGSVPEGATQIGYERDDLLDANGHAVRPYCGITSEPVAPADRNVVQYSIGWRLRVPFKVDSVFSHEDGTIQLKNAIGYRGRTSYNGDEHALFVVHAIFRDRGFVVICDSTFSVLDQVQPEFEAFLASLQHTEEP